MLDAAKAKGLRSGENPAAGAAISDNLLPRRKKLKRGHHPAMPFDDVPAFVSGIARARGGGRPHAGVRHSSAPAALERVVGAGWQEIDRKAKVWTIPGIRMKAGIEHRVPLGPRALEILDTVKSLRGEADWDFPGPRKGKPFSSMAMLSAAAGSDGSAAIHGARLPLIVPGLGRRMHLIPPRGSRGCSGTSSAMKSRGHIAVATRWRGAAS